MPHVAEEEKRRRYELACVFIDEDANGWLFQKEDLRFGSKALYYVPSEYTHKKVSDFPEDVLNLMAAQGHKRRSGGDDLNGSSNSEPSLEEGEHHETSPPPPPPPKPIVLRTTPRPSPSRPQQPPPPKSIDEFVDRVNKAITRTMNKVIEFNTSNIENLNDMMNEKKKGLEEELRVAKRRIEELEAEALAYKEIEHIVKRMKG